MKPRSSVTELTTVQLLWGILKTNERRSFGGIFILMLVGTVVETFSIGLLIPLLAVLTTDKTNLRFAFVSFETDTNRQNLILAVISFVFIVYVLKNIFLGFSVWLQRGYLTRLSARVASQILETYVRQNYSFHLQNNSAVLIRTTQDASVINGGGIEPLISLISECLIVLALFVVLITVEPFGTLLTVAALFLSSLVFHKLSDKKLQQWGDKRQIEKGKIILSIQQSLGAIKDIQVLGREGWFINEHKSHQKLDQDLVRKIVTVQSLPRLWLEVMAIGGLTGLVLFMTSSGRDATKIVPIVGLFAATAFRILPSINKIVVSKQLLKVSRTAIETIYHDLNLPLQEEKLANSSFAAFEDLEVKNLSFAYENFAGKAVNGVSLRVCRAEAVGLIGQSGSGKSTLIDIMLGLLQPQSGSVLINGHDISEVKSSWQQQIGYIPQTIFLMDDSLRRNIAIGISDAEIDERAIHEALKSAQLEDFVASLPEGLDTVVGERGVRLSGGQRQRIGIARALYHRPSVLVLDEATSSLDTETEHGVMQAVQALQGDKTVIIVAHRLSTVEYCDRLYRLDAGRIVDEGTFDEVMNRSQS